MSKQANNDNKIESYRKPICKGHNDSNHKMFWERQSHRDRKDLRLPEASGEGGKDRQEVSGGACIFFFFEYFIVCACLLYVRIYVLLCASVLTVETRRCWISNSFIFHLDQVLSLHLE